MLPAFLVPETTIHDTGTGPVLELPSNESPMLFTLGVEEVVEQESLQVSVFGSVDGDAWPDSALLEWPQKFYRGVSSLYFDPAKQPGIRYLRTQWKTNRWGRGSKAAHFRFYIFAEVLPPHSYADVQGS